MKVRSGLPLLVCGALFALGGYTLAQSSETAKVREELKLQEQKLLKQFKEFEEDVHRLKRRLERSDDPTDREKAELLDQVIEKARDSSIILQFEQINAALRDNKFTNLNEVKDMLAKTGKLADDLANLLELYMGDPRGEKARQQKKLWEDMLKDLKAAIEWQKDVQLRTDIGKADPKELSDAQKKVIALTDTIAKNFDKVGKGGEGGEAGKGPDPKGTPKPGEAKGGAAGESKDGGKENKAGEAKPGEAGKGGDPKKGGEAKPGEAKGAEGAKGGDPKGGDPKGGEAKGGEAKAGEGAKGGEAKAGKGGEASGAKGGGEKKDGAGDKGGPKDEGPKTSKKDKEGAGEAKGAEGAKGGDGDKEKKGGESKPGEGSKGGESKASKGGESKGGESKGGEPKESKGESKPGESSGGKGQPKPGQEGGEAGGGSKGGGDDDKKQEANGRKQVQDAADLERIADDLIRKKKNEDASAKQGDAIENLEKAKKKIEELLKQLREEELERLLAQLQARCEKMLAMQIRVYNETKEIFQVVEGRPGKKADREDQGRSLAQSREEEAIVKEASKAIEMLEAEGSAVAFPEVFQQVREDMKIVQRRLEITDVGVVTQAVESDIIDTLREMVDALKKAREENKDKKKKDDKGGAGKSKDGGPQDQKLLDQIAELKMIRSMQLRINARTTTYGRLYEGEQARDAHIRGELRGLSTRQERLTEVTGRIAKGDNK